MNAIAAEVLSLKWLDAKVCPLIYLKKRLIKINKTMDQDLKGISAWKIILSMIGFFVMLHSSILGYVLVKQSALEVKQTDLSASRMSTSDGANLLAAINAVKTEVAAIPKENPPSWVLAILQKQDAKLEKLEDKVEGLSARK